LKIVAKPDPTTWKHEFTCYKCASKLEADHTDLKYRVASIWYQDVMDDFGGGSYSAKDHYYVVCPVCNTEKELHPNAAGTNIPYLLCERVKQEHLHVEAQKLADSVKRATNE
jgi:transcription elongation factor Elf1